MKSWSEFKSEAPDLAQSGVDLLFRAGGWVGQAFLATLRKDGAPRLHPVSLVHSLDRLYVFIPPGSPKCADLQRDGRFALQAFPPPGNEAGEEFYLSGAAVWIRAESVRRAIIAETGVRVAEGEVLFELRLERAMYTWLEAVGTPAENPQHRIWRADTL